MGRDRRLIHKLLSLAYHPQKSSARRGFPQKKLNSDDHFDPQFLLMGMKGNYETRKKEIISTTIPASKKITTSYLRKEQS
jgi:hypothetical protein